MKLKIMVVALLLACVSCKAWGADVVNVDSLPPLVQLVADKTAEQQVPFSLAYAIIKVESTFDARAYSSGNYGLGQIRCGTARGLGFKGNCKLLFDPETNLTWSILYLKEALDRAKGDWCKAATLYNRGTHAKIGKNPSAYCRRVMAAIPEIVADKKLSFFHL